MGPNAKHALKRIVLCALRMYAWNVKIIIQLIQQMSAIARCAQAIASNAIIFHAIHVRMAISNSMMYVDNARATV